MNDWRGTELAAGDTVVWPYAWGGMRLALCEGIIQTIDSDHAVVYITHDEGDYDRRLPTVRLGSQRLTKVEGR